VNFNRILKRNNSPVDLTSATLTWPYPGLYAGFQVKVIKILRTTVTGVVE